jgi:hypothetical protein
VEKVIAEALGFAECSIRCITVPPQELKAASEAASAGAQRKSERRVQAAGSFPDHLRDPLIDHAVENLKAVPKEIVPLDEVSTSQEEE